MSITDLAHSTTGLDPWFVDALNGLARGTAPDLDGHLVTVGSVQMIGGTKASCHVRFVARDGNDRPLIVPMARMLADHIVDFCIPRSRIKEARQRFDDTGSTDQLMALQREARELFTSISNSGEGGELLLAVLLERLLEAPQLLCKMSLKTSSEMHVHGTDGIHVKALGHGRLALYWGESKLHESVHSAISSAFESIAPFLADDGTGAAQHDLLLVRDHLDTGDPNLDEVLRDYFIEGKVQATMREVRGATLVGFSLDDYPHPHDAEGAVVPAVADAIGRWVSLINTRITGVALDSFDISVFCIPLPSVGEFREAVKLALGH
jgi:hypothetical protein